MAHEQELEIYRQFRTAEDKYSYFLLAAVGAAIGFALNQTNGKALSYSQIPLGIGLFFWSLSFYCGCKHLNYVFLNVYVNFKLFQVQKGEHPDVGNHPQAVQTASEGILNAMESNFKWSSRFASWQFRLFLLGSTSYIAWHIWEMWLRVT